MDLRDYGIVVTDVAFIEAVAVYNQAGNNTWYMNIDWTGNINKNWWVNILYQVGQSRWVLRYKSPDDESLILKVYIKYR